MPDEYDGTHERRKNPSLADLIQKRDSLDVDSFIERIAAHGAQQALKNFRYPSDHFAFVEAMMLKEQRKQEMWRAVKVHVLGWGIVALVGGLGTFVLTHLEHISPK